MKTAPFLIHPLALVDNYSRMVFDLEAQLAKALEQRYDPSDDDILSTQTDQAFYLGLDLDFAKRELENAWRLVDLGVKGVFVKHMSAMWDEK